MKKCQYIECCLEVCTRRCCECRFFYVAKRSLHTILDAVRRLIHNLTDARADTFTGKGPKKIWSRKAHRLSQKNVRQFKKKCRKSEGIDMPRFSQSVSWARSFVVCCRYIILFHPLLHSQFLLLPHFHVMPLFALALCIQLISVLMRRMYYANGMKEYSICIERNTVIVRVCVCAFCFSEYYIPTFERCLKYFERKYIYFDRYYP